MIYNITAITPKLTPMISKKNDNADIKLRYHHGLKIATHELSRNEGKHSITKQSIFQTSVYVLNFYTAHIIYCRLIIWIHFD